MRGRLLCLCRIKPIRRGGGGGGGGGGIFRNFLTKDFEAALCQRQTLVLV